MANLSLGVVALFGGEQTKRHELLPPPPLPPEHHRGRENATHLEPFFIFAFVVLVALALRKRSSKRRKSLAKELDDSSAEWVEIEARYRSRCIKCRQLCTPGDRIYWHRVLRTVRHVDCAAGAKTRVRDVTARALEKLNTVKARGRTSTIAATLAQLPKDSEERYEFLLKVSEIQVTATLDKVDSLKTLTAKRRHLNKAIEKLKRDELSDELQQPQFELLQDILKTLNDLPK
jgi:ribosomal protein L34E